MLTPASVLTNKNCGATEAICLLAAMVCVFLCGCTPPGPQALLRGKELIEEGQYAAAVAKLEKAAELLPKNALAWNYLGLAYHGDAQPEAAAKAYRAALSLDHKLSSVRYNLGCLYLEQTNLAAATEELKSFTLLQPGAAEGWVKLGMTQFQLRRLEEAERSFRTAVELQGKNAEALNGLGLIQVQRRRWQDALAQFNAAAAKDPSYAPALLNAAVVHHQHLNTRTLALQRYRDYLALQPRPTDWDAVDATARRLESELTPAPAVARVAPPAPSSAGSTARHDLSLTASPARSTPQGATAASRTNLPPVNSASRPFPSSNPGRASSSTPQTKSNVEPARALPRLAPAKSLEPPPPRPAEVEVTRVQPDLVVKPAQELSPAKSVSSDTAAVEESSVPVRAATNSAKRGFLSRLNPFSGRNKSGPETVAGEPSAAPKSGGVEASTVSVPRYSYLSPLPPTPGSRLEAEKAFKRGLSAYKDGARSVALKEYGAAVKTDPAYYDAYYNLGLTALDQGDARLSLWAYEIALALKPDGEDARYNFALALKAGGYWNDAVDQLRRILNHDPANPRAHLSLANLYSQQLRQPERARDHYRRVLEINPAHPEAAKIRFWLAANP